MGRGQQTGSLIFILRAMKPKKDLKQEGDQGQIATLKPVCWLLGGEQMSGSPEGKQVRILLLCPTLPHAPACTPGPGSPQLSQSSVPVA
jgi:hypothetical protein